MTHTICVRFYAYVSMPRRTRQVEGRELESSGDGDMALGTVVGGGLVWFCFFFLFLRFGGFSWIFFLGFPPPPPS